MNELSERLDFSEDEINELKDQLKEWKLKQMFMLLKRHYRVIKGMGFKTWESEIFEKDKPLSKEMEIYSNQINQFFKSKKNGVIENSEIFVEAFSPCLQNNCDMVQSFVGNIYDYFIVVFSY